MAKTQEVSVQQCGQRWISLKQLILLGNNSQWVKFKETSTFYLTGFTIHQWNTSYSDSKINSRGETTDHTPSAEQTLNSISSLQSLFCKYENTPGCSFCISDRRGCEWCQKNMTTPESWSIFLPLNFLWLFFLTNLLEILPSDVSIRLLLNRALFWPPTQLWERTWLALAGTHRGEELIWWNSILKNLKIVLHPPDWGRKNCFFLQMELVSEVFNALMISVGTD